MLVKYVTEGIIIALASYYVPIFFKTSLRKPTLNEIISIAITASLTLLILDIYNVG
jgi:hypothetical protein